MINKNDCFDCANLTRRELLNPKSEWICVVTNEPIPDPVNGTQENDCVNFKYEE
jgi:hypothetical protein